MSDLAAAEEPSQRLNRLRSHYSSWFDHWATEET